MFDSPIPQNTLLAALPAKTLHRLTQKLERFELKFSETLYNKGDVITHVYFPESGIISLLAPAGKNASVEIAMVSTDGAIGVPSFLGIKRSNNRAVVQGAGTASRLAVADMLAECELSDELPRQLRLFTHSLLIQFARSAVCNRFHPIEARLTRWLLMTEDRMKTAEFIITQELLSHMLGVRREAVNKTAIGLQRQKIISYSRGHMTILDRPALEKIACDCYGAAAGNLWQL